MNVIIWLVSKYNTMTEFNCIACKLKQIHAKQLMNNSVIEEQFNLQQGKVQVLKMDFVLLFSSFFLDFHFSQYLSSLSFSHSFTHTAYWYSHKQALASSIQQIQSEMLRLQYISLRLKWVYPLWQNYCCKLSDTGFILILKASNNTVSLTLLSILLISSTVN